MKNNYEINSYTLAIIPINCNTTKVIEFEGEFLVAKSANEIIQDSCSFFGSSYEGRHKGTKSLLGINYKAPIIIEETASIIFFPTRSPRYDDCVWISLNQIRDYQRAGNQSAVTFKNNVNIVLNISYGMLENQIFRATRLDSVLRERKKLCLI